MWGDFLTTKGTNYTKDGLRACFRFVLVFRGPKKRAGLSDWPCELIVSLGGVCVGGVCVSCWSCVWGAFVDGLLWQWGAAFGMMWGSGWVFG
ncbi:membrane protein [Rhodopirellula sp. SWK7]|nr:membrane protein [Rhodopirellula sp. SWK7]